MPVTPQMFLIVCPLIFLASLTDAIGGGGGLISLPAYLLAGLPPALAGGSNKLSASSGTLIATLKYLRDGKILLRPGLCAVLGALPGAYLGAQLLQRVDERFVRVFLLVVIPLMAAVILLRRNAPTRPKPVTTARLAGCFLLGLACGFYDGFAGPGTGTMLIIGLTYLIGMDMVTASGTAKLINLASNVTAFWSLFSGGNVLFPLALAAIPFSIAGGYLGSRLAIRRGAALIRKITLGVLALILIRLAFHWM